MICEKMDLFDFFLLIIGLVFLLVLLVLSYIDSKLIVKRDSKMIELLEKIVDLLNEKDRW